MSLLSNSNGNMTPLAIMLLVSLVVALYLRANRENFYVTGAATYAGVKLGKRAIDHTRNIPLAANGVKSYGTKCKKHERFEDLKPGEQGPCKTGYYFQEKKQLGCIGQASRAVCSRINVPKLDDFNKKVRKSRVDKFKAPGDPAGDAYCNAAKGVESGYMMTEVKGAGRGKRRYYCAGLSVENPDADTRVAYQTGCKKQNGAVGEQGNCKDTFTTSEVFKSNCFGAKRSMCTPNDYDMSVYPVNVSGDDPDLMESDEEDDSGDEGDELKNLREELDTCQRRRKKDWTMMVEMRKKDRSSKKDDSPRRKRTWSDAKGWTNPTRRRRP